MQSLRAGGSLDCSRNREKSSSDQRAGAKGHRAEVRQGQQSQGLHQRAAGGIAAHSHSDARGEGPR